MRSFISSARLVAKAEGWHGAIALALILPDICGSIDYPDLPSSERFIAWWDDRLKRWFSLPFLPRGQSTFDVDFPPPLGPKMSPETHLSGLEAWDLRCAFLHSGQTLGSDPNLSHDIRFFEPPTAASFLRHGGTLFVTPAYLVERVCLGVEEWIEEAEVDPYRASMLVDLMKLESATGVPLMGDGV
ncbi:hypothetical protein [Caulobacter sp. 1776]|uniref:hypothetical protein n=1 Tax=Caulobacter sp. 1776 TaxID=3156420 RepID=UPI00339ADE00